MSQENVDRLQAGYEAFSRGEPDDDLLAPDYVLHQASSIVDTAGVFEGPSGIRDVVAELEEAFEDFSVEPEEFTVAPTGEIVVLVHARGRGRGSGMQIDNHIAHVWTFREGRAVRTVVYEEPDEALEAVGLGEMKRS